MLARCHLSFCVCICHKSEFYEYELTDRAGFWRGCSCRHILHRVLNEFGYLQNKSTSLLELCSKLWTEKISPRARLSSQCAVNLVRTIVGRTKLIILATVDRTCITRSVRFRLQHVVREAARRAGPTTKLVLVFDRVDTRHNMHYYQAQ